MDPHVRDSPPSTPLVTPPRSGNDWSGSGWKHPYVIYLFATVALFGFLLLMGYLAIENEWIPKRGGSVKPSETAPLHRMITLQPFNPSREG
ncbi:MAG: hypothetical protein H7301_08595 [Cryobacterium sp.]|nr:hypothetical protein [Oligoflexia bacterium]